MFKHNNALNTHSTLYITNLKKYKHTNDKPKVPAGPLGGRQSRDDREVRSLQFAVFDALLINFMSIKIYKLKIIFYVFILS